MRYRPKRENYSIGQFGEIDYQEMLERYCTYLENQNKQLRLHVVSKSFYCNNEVIGLKTQCSKQCKECSNWIKTAFKQ